MTIARTVLLQMMLHTTYCRIQRIPPTLLHNHTPRPETAQSQKRKSTFTDLSYVQQDPHAREHVKRLASPQAPLPILPSLSPDAQRTDTYIHNQPTKQYLPIHCALSSSHSHTPQPTHGVDPPRRKVLQRGRKACVIGQQTRPNVSRRST